jgi:hypothetical protein
MSRQSDEMKKDGGKVRMDLLPPEFLEATAAVLTFGAEKYADHKWEEGMAWSRVYASLQRHLNAWWRGEDTDEETGKSHLWHASCCIAFLTTYEIRGVGEDDRYSKLKGK